MIPNMNWEMNWLGAAEVAELLRLHLNTVKRIPPSELPYFKFGSRGDRRYRRADVDRYVESKMVYR